MKIVVLVLLTMVILASATYLIFLGTYLITGEQDFEHWVFNAIMLFINYKIFMSLFTSFRLIKKENDVK